MTADMSKLEALSSSLKKWPESDRRALENCIDVATVDLFEDLSEGSLARDRGAAWAETSLANNVRFYTYYLQFLERCGELHSIETPSARVTKKRLNAFIDGLTHLSSQSRLSYVRGVNNVVAVIDPGGDRKYLEEVVRKLRRLARPSRNQTHLMISPSDLFYAGIRRMDRVTEQASGSVIQAGRYRDGLMMAAIACKALRRRNFAGMMLERNITRNTMDFYEVRFRPSETKTRSPIQAQLSRALTPYFDLWLTTLRPMLLNGRSSDALWVTIAGADMSGETFHKCFCKATKQELGEQINPHAVRKIVATGVAIARPELVKMVGSLLDHRGEQSVAAYNLADQLSASKRYLELLDERRRRALNGKIGSFGIRVSRGSPATA